MARVLQCVASRGLVSRVNVTTSSTRASLIVRGAPGRGSSSRPSSRLARNRLRHFPTVCFVNRRCRATRVFVSSAAHARITRARCASAWAVVGRRAQRSSVSRSSSVSAKGGIGRPIRMRVLLSTGRTLTAHTLFQLFQTHETRSTGHISRPTKPLPFGYDTRDGARPPLPPRPAPGGAPHVHGDDRWWSPRRVARRRGTTASEDRANRCSVARLWPEPQHGHFPRLTGAGLDRGTEHRRRVPLGGGPGGS